MRSLKKYTLFISIFFCISSQAQTQQENAHNINPSCGCPYTLAERRFAVEEELSLYVDVQASFVGGVKAQHRFESWLMQNPAKNAADSANHSILCRFVIERDGSISNIELLTHNDKQFEDEAYKIIKAMPKWNPATKEKQAVRSWQLYKLFFGYPAPTTPAKK